MMRNDQKSGIRGRIVIPARLASTRLPRKLLLSVTGKPLIQHTYEAAQKSRLASGLCVATDSEEIFEAVKAFGGQVFMTSPACASGTDRIAEVAEQLDNTDVIVNVQGDEPELSGEAIDLVMEILLQSPTAAMATLATPIRSHEKLLDPSCVKVVLSRVKTSAFTCQVFQAIYFSRAPIPHVRDGNDKMLTSEPPCFFQHIGLYAYRKAFLLQLAKWPRTPLEQLENLEQLRVLENRHEILVGIVDEPTVGIDTASDYADFVVRFRDRS